MRTRSSDDDQKGTPTCHVADGRVLADPSIALTTSPSPLSPVQYFPREDVDMSLWNRRSPDLLPYKGDCSTISVANATRNW